MGRDLFFLLIFVPESIVNIFCSIFQLDDTQLIPVRHINIGKKTYDCL